MIGFSIFLEEYPNDYPLILASRPPLRLQVQTNLHQLGGLIAVRAGKASYLEDVRRESGHYTHLTK